MDVEHRGGPADPVRPKDPEAHQTGGPHGRRVEGGIHGEVGDPIALGLLQRLTRGLRPELMEKGGVAEASTSR